jgi:hypothetical protein
MQGFSTFSSSAEPNLTVTYDRTTYTVSGVPTGSIILFTPDGTPIVRLETTAMSPFNRPENTTMTQRSKNAFQSFFSGEGVSFGFTLENYTSSPVAFHIRRRNSGKGIAINRINLLNGKHTLHVTTDTTTRDINNAECTMILETLKETAVDGSVKNVTVRQDEHRLDGKTPEGSYFEITIAPTSANDDWREAVWACPSFICTQKSNTFGSNSGSWGRQDSPAYGGYSTNSPSFSPSSPLYRGAFSDEYQLASFGAFCGTGEGSGGSVGGGFGRAAGIPTSAAAFSGAGGGWGGGGGGQQQAKRSIRNAGSGAGARDPSNYSFGASASAGFGAAPAPAAVAGFGSGGGYFGAAAGFAAEMAPPSQMSLPPDASAPPSDFDLGCMSTSPDIDGDEAFAATIRHGQTQKVESRRVAIDVHYNKAAPIATLLLSIASSERMVYYPQPSAEKRAQLMLACVSETIASKTTRLLASLKTVFDDYKECVICTDEDKPRVVIIACGHKACCADCVSELEKRNAADCPICRGHIKAVLKV